MRLSVRMGGTVSFLLLLAAFSSSQATARAGAANVESPDQTVHARIATIRQVLERAEQLLDMNEVGDRSLTAVNFIAQWYDWADWMDWTDTWSDWTDTWGDWYDR